MTKKQKIKRDGEALKAYRKTMEQALKDYAQTFTATAVNQRRSRAAAIGECVMQAMAGAAALAKTKPLIMESLVYLVSEKKTEDENGKKYFFESVSFYVHSSEPRYTQEEIDREIQDTFERMMRETDEMFPEEEGHGKGETEEGGGAAL